MQCRNFIKVTVRRGFGFRKNLPVRFGQNMQTKITAHVRKPAVIMATVKNVLPFTGHIRSMYRTACVR